MAGPTVDLYGQGTKLFEWLHGVEQAPREVMFEGVAGSSKTRTWAEWIRAACLLFPGSKGLVLRETRVSLNESFLDIWEEHVLGQGHPAMRGANRRNRSEYVFPERQAILHRGTCPRCSESGNAYQPLEWYLDAESELTTWPCQRCGTPLVVERPNGGLRVRRTSRVVLGGMDNKTRLFSTEYNWAYWNEMQEGSLEDWESLHRALRRKGMPFWLLGGDCNPDADTHWANQRAMPDELNPTPRIHRLVGYFHDNPTITQEYVDRLFENLTGVGRERLAYGRWVRAEGAVWGDFRREVHMVHGEIELRGTGSSKRHFLRLEGNKHGIAIKWFLAGLDWGHHAPGCLGIWAFDAAGTMYEVAECYRTGWSLDQWAEMAAHLYREFPFLNLICDHDPAAIKLLNDRLGPYCGRRLPALAVRWEKRRQGKETEKAGIDVVRVRLRNAMHDKHPGIYWLHGNRRGGVDPDLKMRKRPTSTVDEIPGWVYPVYEDGKPVKDEPDPSCPDHGCDMTRAVAYWVHLRDLAQPKEPKKYPPRSYGAVLGHEQVLGKR